MVSLNTVKVFDNKTQRCCGIQEPTARSVDESGPATLLQAKGHIDMPQLARKMLFRVLFCPATQLIAKLFARRG